MEIPIRMIVWHSQIALVFNMKVIAEAIAIQLALQDFKALYVKLFLSQFMYAPINFSQKDSQKRRKTMGPL